MRFFALALALIAAPALAQVFAGRIVAVHDGDTLTVLHEDKRITVHLAEVDAPELRQSFGVNAKESLERLCLDKTGRVEITAHDRRGALARVSCDGVDASAEQVKRGMAWVYRRQGKSDSPLHFYEDVAQRNRDGLWVDRAAAPPWAYRANRRNSR